ncbi:hypothetical protein ScPMuIL_012820 [Solemya velum]
MAAAGRARLSNEVNTTLLCSSFVQGDNSGATMKLGFYIILLTLVICTVCVSGKGKSKDHGKKSKTKSSGKYESIGQYKKKSGTSDSGIPDSSEEESKAIEQFMKMIFGESDSSEKESSVGAKKFGKGNGSSDSSNKSGGAKKSGPKGAKKHKKESGTSGNESSEKNSNGGKKAWEGKGGKRRKGRATTKGESSVGAKKFGKGNGSSDSSNKSGGAKKSGSKVAKKHKKESGTSGNESSKKMSNEGEKAWKRKGGKGRGPATTKKGSSGSADSSGARAKTEGQFMKMVFSGNVESTEGTSDESVSSVKSTAGEDGTIFEPPVNKCSDPELNDCHADADCSMKKGVYVCVCKPGFVGNGKQCRDFRFCSVDGEGNVDSFDHQMFSLNNDDTHLIMLRNDCGGDNSNFQIVRGSATVAEYGKSRLLAITISGDIINIYENGVHLNGVKIGLPYTRTGQYSIIPIGDTTVMTTSVGLEIRWKTLLRSAMIGVPRGLDTCGLCGGYNGNKDDDLTMGPSCPDEETSITNNVGHFISSWVESYGLENPDIIVCSDIPPPPKCEEGLNKMKARFFCRLLHNMNGPLEECFSTMDPEVIEDQYDLCVNDMCLNPDNAFEILCERRDALIASCMVRNVPVNDHASECGKDLKLRNRGGGHIGVEPPYVYSLKRNAARTCTLTRVAAPPKCGAAIPISTPDSPMTDSVSGVVSVTKATTWTGASACLMRNVAVSTGKTGLTTR